MTTPDEDLMIPFTPEDYGITLQIIVNYANLLIEDDESLIGDPENPVDPDWLLIQEFFRRMHGAELKDQPRDNSPLQMHGPSTNEEARRNLEGKPPLLT